MNANLNLNFDPKQILAAISRYRKLMVSVVILGLLGYTGYQISQITAVEADQAYTTAKSKESEVVNLRVNKDTLDQLKQLRAAGVTPASVNIGKHDPFSL